MPQLSDLKQALRQIEALQATLNALKQKVAAQMEPDKDDAGKLRCWACGGRLRRTVQLQTRQWAVRVRHRGA
jgi:hypothetical protein